MPLNRLRRLIFMSISSLPDLVKVLLFRGLNPVLRVWLPRLVLSLPCARLRDLRICRTLMVPSGLSEMVSVRPGLGNGSLAFFTGTPRPLVPVDGVALGPSFRFRSSLGTSPPSFVPVARCLGRWAW